MCCEPIERRVFVLVNFDLLSSHRNWISEGRHQVQLGKQNGGGGGGGKDKKHCSCSCNYDVIDLPRMLKAATRLT